MIIDTNNKQHSPRSPLKKCEEELIVTLLMSTIKNNVEIYHKDFNPIAQGTPFYLRKVPKGEMFDYLNYLNFTTLCGNFSILSEAVRIFEIICNKKPDIVHQQTVHRILGVCCLIVAKFYYDGYNSLHFGQVLGVRKEKLIIMESFLFFDVLEGKLNFIKNDNNEKMMIE